MLANFQVANWHTLQDKNYFLVLGFGPVTSDGQKAMHMSPPCICTGVLKNGMVPAFRFCIESV